MGGLSSHFYPWGFVVQGVALWHFVKRRPEGYWLYIIIFGSVLGAGAYIVVEMIPDLGLRRGVFQGFGRRSGIQAVELQVRDNPSWGELGEVAALYVERENYGNAGGCVNCAVFARETW